MSARETDIETEAAPEDAPLHGVLAEYDTPHDLKKAAAQVRDAGYRDWDTFTPFPIHGMEKAMGIEMTKLPWIVFIGGLTGLATAILLQWWTNAFDYPWVISGKPIFSLPANIPIAFELTVLFSVFSCLGGMLMLNRLPHPSHPLDLKRRFARVTDDKFFLLIQASDPKFDEGTTRNLLDGTHPVFIEDVPEDRVTPERVPSGLIYGLVILATASLVPFALFASARESHTDKPRIHIIQDMDSQPYFKSQRSNPFFEDERADRLPVPGTVASGDLREDDHLYRGRDDGGWARTFPPQLEPTAENMARGKQRFDIFCAPCHGLTGQGTGMVNNRAQELAQGTWVPPTDMTQEHLRKMPVGELFNSITNGVRNMPAYGPQIKPEDRWAILLYVRALQRSRATSVNDLSETERASLK
ncbi:MAG TPA: quinol:electron acceptor oxidoreductase subunit ActD [Polyangiaceae bacterium]|nr:quinol:electron acceptor oxidoreductase subunit ActD [Polyangiaceae bacterium]